jgi:hypothetical protein
MEREILHAASGGRSADVGIAPAADGKFDNPVLSQTLAERMCQAEVGCHAARS